MKIFIGGMGEMLAEIISRKVPAVITSVERALIGFWADFHYSKALIGGSTSVPLRRYKLLRWRQLSGYDLRKKHYFCSTARFLTNDKTLFLLSVTWCDTLWSSTYINMISVCQTGNLDQRSYSNWRNIRNSDACKTTTFTQN